MSSNIEEQLKIKYEEIEVSEKNLQDFSKWLKILTSLSKAELRKEGRKYDKLKRLKRKRNLYRQKLLETEISIKECRSTLACNREEEH